MKKNTKTVSYIFVLSVLLSLVQPVEAQINWLKRDRILETAQQAAQRFQKRVFDVLSTVEMWATNLLHALDEYRQCIMSKEGCSPEQKAKLRKARRGIGAAVALALLYLAGRSFRRQQAAEAHRAKEIREAVAVEQEARENLVWRAIREGRVELLQNISRPADLLSLRNAQGKTPLIEAIISNASWPVIGWLIFYSTPQTINQIYNNKTALDYADEKKRDHNIIGALERNEAKHAREL